MIYILFTIIIICIISAFICHFNIGITEYNIQNEKIDKNLDGYKILQLSDLHNRAFGKDSGKLIKKIDTVSPDIIVITGDLFDKRASGISNMLKLVKNLTSKYPCYYIIGNHELRLGQAKFQYVLTELKKMGVVILNNEHKELSENVKLYGIGYNLKTDLSKGFEYKYKEEITKEDIEREVGSLNTTNFNILLAHTPFSFEAYSETGFDLILSGHVHGGIIRLPFLGGLLSPQRKFFPKYSEGIYTKGNSKMIVSRGLGYGGLKFRMFNNPEIVVVTLKNS